MSPLGRSARVAWARPALQEIHHQHIQFGRSHEIDGLAPAGCLSYQAQVDVLREELSQAGADDDRVVRNSDLDHLNLPGWFESFPRARSRKTASTQPECLS